MIIEEENAKSKEKMKKIYDSIKSNPKLKKHLNIMEIYTLSFAS